jgi:hypothetical protein
MMKRDSWVRYRGSASISPAAVQEGGSSEARQRKLARKSEEAWGVGGMGRAYNYLTYGKTGYGHFDRHGRWALWLLMSMKART